jgi:hypothetical protein
MKLYLLSRTDRVDYDEYDSFVVAAESEEEALKWFPRGNKSATNEYYDGWVSKEDLKIECIGESNSSVEKVILASFNAG